MPLLGLHSCGSSHAFGGFPHNGESNTGARVGSVVMDTLKDFEDTLLRLRRNADAIILKPEAHESGRDWIDGGFD